MQLVEPHQETKTHFDETDQQEHRPAGRKHKGEENKVPREGGVEAWGGQADRKFVSPLLTTLAMLSPREIKLVSGNGTRGRRAALALLAGG